jgi:hypothetical protein
MLSFLPRRAPGAALLWKRSIGAVVAFALIVALIGVGSSATASTGATTRLVGSMVETTATRVGEIRRLYLAYFDREPDDGGSRYWLAQRAHGVSLGRVSYEFSRSAEFVQRYGELDAQGFVSLAYRNVLDREQDPAGFDYWVRQLESGVSRGSVMVNFSESTEFRRLSASRRPPQPERGGAATEPSLGSPAPSPAPEDRAGADSETGTTTTTAGPTTTTAAPTTTTAAPTTTTTTAAPSPGSLAWAPPALSDPQTVDVPTSGGVLRLDSGRDYIVEFPDRAVTGGVGLNGGRNVVIVGGEISIPWQG